MALAKCGKCGGARAPQAATLSKGARVTIHGPVARLMMSVPVKRCEFVSP